MGPSPTPYPPAKPKSSYLKLQPNRRPQIEHIMWGLITIVVMTLFFFLQAGEPHQGHGHEVQGEVVKRMRDRSDHAMLNWRLFELHLTSNIETLADA